MEELIHHILYVSHQEKQNITLLQLNLVAYFACGYLLKHGYHDLVEEFYKTEQFEGRPNGPSLPLTNKRYQQYHSLPLLEAGKESGKLRQVEGLDEALTNLIKRDVFDLVSVSQKHEFWQYNKVFILSQIRVKYGLYDLKRAFLEPVKL